jgi:small acid-soluble spore protein I (minor)
MPLILYQNSEHTSIVKSNLKGVNNMNLNLRNAIISNINDNNEDQIRETIVDAITSGEEKMLPGLGVLFELMWQKCSPEQQEEVINNIRESLA